MEDRSIIVHLPSIISLKYALLFLKKSIASFLVLHCYLGKLHHKTENQTHLECISDSYNK